MPRESGKRGAPSLLDATRQEWLNEKLTEYLKVSERKDKTRWLNGTVDAWFARFPYHLKDEPEEFRIITYLEKKSDASKPQSQPSHSANTLDSATSPNSPSTTQGVESTASSTSSDTGQQDGTTSVVAGYEKQLEEMSEQMLKELRSRRQAAKESILKDAALRKTVRSWFGQKRLQANNASGARNPFKTWFQHIKDKGRESTRAMPDYQWYLKSDQHGPKVKEEFEKRWKAMGKAEKYRLHYLCETAKEMLEAESDDVKNTLKEENEEDHRRRVQTANELLGGEEMTEAVAQDSVIKETCRKHIGVVAQPMVDGVNCHTDYICVMLCGRAPRPGESKFDLAVSGATSPKNGQKGLKIHEFRPEEFKTKMLNYFMDFLLETVDDAVPGEGLGHTLATTLPNPADDPTMLSFDDNAAKESETRGSEESRVVDTSKKNSAEDGTEKEGIRTKERGKEKGKEKGKERGKGKEGKRHKRKNVKAKGRSEVGEEEEAISSDSDRSSDSEDPKPNSPSSPNPPRRSTRPRPVPVNIKTFVERLPKDWLAPTVLDAIKRLPPSELMKVLKQLQTAADTRNVVEFNRQVMIFSREYPTYMTDAVIVEAQRKQAADKNQMGMEGEEGVEPMEGVENHHGKDVEPLQSRAESATDVAASSHDSLGDAVVSGDASSSHSFVDSSGGPLTQLDDPNFEADHQPGTGSLDAVAPVPVVSTSSHDSSFADSSLAPRDDSNLGLSGDDEAHHHGTNYFWDWVIGC
ncbi:hypothetical protein VKT23_020038 [Stygiomarasmius scandens]|uniref:Uncharacterized protein n=1 Tax=Marasmiellus scandens TaxID=2682957 RepID=A0ABR1IM18_9AGAR